MSGADAGRALAGDPHRPRWIAALVAVACLDVVVHAVGFPEVSGMPTLPWWASVLATVGAAAALTTRWADSWRFWLAAAAVMWLSSLPVLPHDLLVVISDVMARVTGGHAFFEVDPPWIAVARNIAVAATGAAAAWRGVTLRRLARGRCPRCGRRPDVRPAAVRRPLLLVACALAALAPLPYVWLKLEWGRGSTVGLADADYFAGVTLSTPGFGDTALLGAVGVGAAVAMACVPRARVVRAALLGVGTLGSVMLLPVGVLGSLMLVAAALTPWTVQGTEVLHAWVFVLVYGGFLLWGVGLATATWQYARASRPPCPRHPGDDAPTADPTTVSDSQAVRSSQTPAP